MESVKKWATHTTGKIIEKTTNVWKGHINVHWQSYLILIISLNTHKKGNTHWASSSCFHSLGSSNPQTQLPPWLFFLHLHIQSQPIPSMSPACQRSPYPLITPPASWLHSGLCKATEWPPKDLNHAGLTPVILATQEAQIRRITVQSQPGQIVLEMLSRKTLHKKGWWSDSGVAPEFKPQYCQKKKKKKKKARIMCCLSYVQNPVWLLHIPCSWLLLTSAHSPLLASWVPSYYCSMSGSFSPCSGLRSSVTLAKHLLWSPKWT
jgi:hypothetical protein